MQPTDERAGKGEELRNASSAPKMNADGVRRESQPEVNHRRHRRNNTTPPPELGQNLNA